MKFEGLQLYYKQTPTQVFSVNIAKFLRQLFYKTPLAAVSISTKESPD